MSILTRNSRFRYLGLMISSGIYIAPQEFRSMRVRRSVAREPLCSGSLILQGSPETWAGCAIALKVMFPTVLQPQLGQHSQASRNASEAADDAKPYQAS